MGKLYKISAETANNIGVVAYGENFEFNPYCSEQNDGSFIVNGDLLDDLISQDLINISSDKLEEVSEISALANAKIINFHS